MEDYLWATDHLDSSLEGWSVPYGRPWKPHEDPFWYYTKICELIYNSRSRITNGYAEAAATMAFEAGKLFNEFEVSFHHNDTFMKYQSVRESQWAAATSRMGIDYETRRRTYFKFLERGDKPTLAAEYAASELGFRSSRSIAFAFPNNRLPKKES